jgi:polyphosphate kinase
MPASGSSSGDARSVARQLVGRALLVALFLASELLIHLELVARGACSLIGARRSA